MTVTNTKKRRERLKRIRDATTVVDCLLLDLRKQEWRDKPIYRTSLTLGFESLYYLERLARKAP